MAAPYFLASFACRIVQWQKQHGRTQLPWHTTDPYCIWLSEIMLQQTQVNTAIPYYRKFIARFPTVHTLAAASLEEVLSLWSGLGYYTRARCLHQSAQIIVQQYQGIFPKTSSQLLSLPGIGRSTAAAIAAFAFRERSAILDGNVKRVLARHQGVHGLINSKKVTDSLWQIAEQLLPVSHQMATYTQGMMDLGSLICKRTKPQCVLCPISQDCYAFKHNIQMQLPARAATKQLALRQTIMLIIFNSQQQILFQQRPLTGIWPGLWSLPEVAMLEHANAYCQDLLGLKNISLYPLLSSFIHSFTHYRLMISPLPIKLYDDNDTAVYSASSVGINQQWLGIDQSLRLGLPMPVRKILSELSLKSFSP